MQLLGQQMAFHVTPPLNVAALGLLLRLSTAESLRSLLLCRPTAEKQPALVESCRKAGF